MPLQNPTVAEVIAVLQTMPQDAQFRVETAETPGREDVVYIDLDMLGRVWVSGGVMQRSEYSMNTEQHSKHIQ